MTPRIVAFGICEPKVVETDGEPGTLVAWFTACFDLGSLGEVELAGWSLVRIGSARFCIRAPEVIGPGDAAEPIRVPNAWQARLLARAIWRYRAEIDPKVVEHLGAGLRADIGLPASTRG